MNQASLQKIKAELEAQEKKEFRNAMKSKVQDRIDTRGLPHYAKINNKNVIECQICRFSTKDQMTFFNHVKTKKHQSALEQLNQMQEQSQAKAQAQQAAANGKRPATHELYVDSEDYKTDQNKTKARGPQPVSSLVSYQDDDEDEEDVGPVGPVPTAQPEERQNKDSERVGMEEDNENKEVREEMIVEKPTAMPQGFFDKQEDAEEMRKRVEMQKAAENYKSFMEEIKKTSGEDADEILKELGGDISASLEEQDQEILDKVIKQDEEEIEDAQDYISNLRKRIGLKGKTETQAGQNGDNKGEKKDDKKHSKMEDEDEGAGFKWKKRGLF